MTEVVDLCGADILCVNEATHVVALDRIDPRQRAYKICGKHKDELMRKCKILKLPIEEYIEPLPKEDTSS